MHNAVPLDGVFAFYCAGLASRKPAMWQIRRIAVKKD